MDNSYMDYLSTLDRQESGEGIKDLFKDHFDIIRPLLNDVYWVDAFTAYLNYTCGVSQTKIGELVNSGLNTDIMIAVFSLSQIAIGFSSVTKCSPKNTCCSLKSSLLLILGQLIN